MYKSTVLLVALLLISSGCTNIHVQPLEASQQISQVCIQVNEKVIVKDFLSIVREGFEAHGISTILLDGRVNGSLADRCQAILTYTAFKTWDIATYMHHAELRLEDLNRNKLASAEYHLNGRGGLALNKWASTRSKMKPVIDKLLGAY